MKWVLLLLFLVACSPTPTEIYMAPTKTTIVNVLATTNTPIVNQTPTILPSVTQSPSVTPSLTPAPTVTPTLLPTAYGNGKLNCSGGVALMYHRIYSSTKYKLDSLGIGSDIESFRNVMIYLVNNGYYFPTPMEFAMDIEDLVCERKYAIVIIDDSWNDPETMGVTKVLLSLRDEKNSPGSAKVWLGLITRMIVPFVDDSGTQIDQWDHLRELQNQDIVYVVSHSQTHSVALVDKSDIFNPVNDGVYEEIAEELLPSRKDIYWEMDCEPWFFVYPGGNVTQVVSDSLKGSGYSGAFTVDPGGLDKSYPGYLPRINGGYGCDKTVENNAKCVIEMIKFYSSK